MKFKVTGKKTKGNVTQLKNFKEKQATVWFSSDIPLFSNQCTVQVKIGEDEFKQTFEYNNYIHEDGELATD